MLRFRIFFSEKMTKAKRLCVVKSASRYISIMLRKNAKIIALRLQIPHELFPSNISGNSVFVCRTHQTAAGLDVFCYHRPDVCLLSGFWQVY